MGVWAEGNFDSDGAMDYLAELLGQMSQTIDEILADETRSRIDEEGETILMPCVEIMALLCERYHAAPPKAGKIAGWRTAYLRVYDAQIDGMAPEGDYKVRRRKVIDNTFQWLASVAQSFWTK